MLGTSPGRGMQRRQPHSATVSESLPRHKKQYPTTAPVPDFNSSCFCTACPVFESRFRGTHLSQSQGPAQTEVSNGSCQTVRVAGLCAADMCAASQQRTTAKLSDTHPSCRTTRAQCEASANISRYIMQQGYLHQHRLGRLPARLVGSVHRPPLPDLSSTFSHLRSPWHTWRSACSCRYTSPAATSAQRRSSIDCSAATQFAQADFQNDVAPATCDSLPNPS